MISSSNQHKNPPPIRAAGQRKETEMTEQEIITIDDKRYKVKAIEQLSDGLTVRMLLTKYEPERYWLNTNTMEIQQKPEGHHWVNPEFFIEVTPEYAEYLRNKPDGEWELRMVVVGNVYRQFGSSLVSTACRNVQDDGPHDRGYRWCRPKVTHGWREYAVVERNGVYYVKGYRGGDMALHKALCRVGFGGVQFEGCDTWSMLVAAYRRDETLYIYDSGEIPSVTATPIKVRFWEARQ